MLKRRLCEATLTWTLTCPGPLLIADGRYDMETLPKEKGKYPNKLFVNRATDKAMYDAVQARPAATLGLPFYIPGTSLRGPFRAQAERIIRSLLPEDIGPPRTACDPFAMGNEPPLSCSRRLHLDVRDVPYAAVCPACKLFGCTGTASRIYFTDADLEAPGPESPSRSVYRDMIGIDRFTGGVSQGANMRFHALENTSFTTTVSVTNFESWQLGLLAYVFRDFAMGLIPIGFGKTKGFGLVRGEVTRMTLTYVSGTAQGRIEHLGSLSSAAERERYGLHAAAAPHCALTPVQAEGLSLFETFAVDDCDAFWAAVAPTFNAFIQEQKGEIHA